MHELAIGSAFVAGALGSSHCVAMCGGLATALGTRRNGTLRARPLLYQTGRLTSYAAAGAIVGSLGAAAGFAFEASKWSAVLRLGTAAVVVLIGLNIALGPRLRGPWLGAPERWGALAWRRIAPLSSRLPKQPAARALTLGLLWGWLPCGLVYSVLVAAALAGSALAGGVTMIAFGLGTLPAMLGLSYASGRFTPPGATLSRLLGSAIVACGLWTASMPIAMLFGPHEHIHAMAQDPAHSRPLKPSVR
jgi:sulfite exporter TauE/SafE